MTYYIYIQDIHHKPYLADLSKISIQGENMGFQASETVIDWDCDGTRNMGKSIHRFLAAVVREPGDSMVLSVDHCWPVQKDRNKYNVTMWCPPALVFLLL